jgi:hypothetical protein
LSKRGRKPTDPEHRNSEVVGARVRPDVYRGLERLAKIRKRKLSREIQRALDHWIVSGGDRPPHSEALSRALVLAAEYIEKSTERSWRKDPWTSRAVQCAVLIVVKQLAAKADGNASPAIPPAITGAMARRWLPEVFGKPEEFGALIAGHVVRELEQAAQPSRTRNEWSTPVFFTAAEEILGNIGRHLVARPKKEQRR